MGDRREQDEKQKRQNITGHQQDGTCRRQRGGASNPKAAE